MAGVFVTIFIVVFGFLFVVVLHAIYGTDDVALPGEELTDEGRDARLGRDRNARLYDER